LHNLNERFLFVVIVVVVVAIIAFASTSIFVLLLVVFASIVVSLAFLTSLLFVVILFAFFVLLNSFFNRDIERTCKSKKIKIELTIYNSCLMLSMRICLQTKFLYCVSLNNELRY